MLVLTRSLGKSIVIDGALTATVIVIGHEYVELSLAEESGPSQRTVTLSRKEYAELGRGVRAIVVRIEDSRCRLGLESPPGVCIDRAEFREIATEHASRQRRFS